MRVLPTYLAEHSPTFAHPSLDQRVLRSWRRVGSCG
jgi:hypothetical protein